MSLNPNINFSTLKETTALWQKRFPCIEQVFFFNSLDGIRPYILLFVVSNTESSYVGNIGMGIKKGSVAARELMKCVLSQGDNLNHWVIYTKIKNKFTKKKGLEGEKTYYINEKWFGNKNYLLKSDFEKKIYKKSKIRLFPEDNLPYKKEASKKSFEEELDSFLQKIYLDISCFYGSLKQRVKNKKKSLERASKQDIDHSFYSVQKNLKYLIKEDIEGCFDKVNSPTRDIQGKLAQKIISRLQPHLLVPKISTDYQALYRRIKQLKL